jgi:PadR family transcriptional regulator, regulatory protein PadR
MRRFLGEFEQLLLLALVQARDEAYGVEIRRAIEERTGRTVSPGACYTALDRLERRRLVSSRLGDPTAQRGGKRKRYYRLEPAGLALLRASQQTLARMARGVGPALEIPELETP